MLRLVPTSCTFSSVSIGKNLEPVSQNVKTILQMALELKVIEFLHDSAKVAGEFQEGFKYFFGFLFSETKMGVIHSVLAKLINEKKLKKRFLLFLLQKGSHFPQDTPIA